MRLIDVDKLPATCNVAIVNGKLEVNGWIAAKRIEEAPTVNAIPIEWIENWLETCIPRFDYDRMTYMADAYEMLEDWEQENEAN